MCGLVAIYSYQTRNFNPKTLKAMTDSIRHRGPDDYGFSFIGPGIDKNWKENLPDNITSIGIAMGHRRLSILDLSDAGRQPFVSNNKRFSIVYNGEIFNYLELKDELMKSGCKFRTTTDTEVLLTAYEYWGIDFLNHLNGMWAFVIWDNLKKQMLVSRDRFGIKPLYYYHGKGQWIFASEIKALLQHPIVPKEPDNKTIFHYLSTAMPPEKQGETYFKDISSVEPATYLLINNDNVEIKRFWNLPPYAKNNANNKQGLSKCFINIFKDSVRLRLRSDVKVGTMVSGGLDSTSIAEKINELLMENSKDSISVGKKQHAFSASFPDTAMDETVKVEELCSQLKLSVSKVYPSNVDISKIFSKVVYHMEMPFSKSTPLVQYLLMNKAKEEGVKVVLNGHGADEMLGGYGERYCPLVAAGLLARLRFKEALNEIKIMKKRRNIGLSETLYSLLCISFPVLAYGLKNIMRHNKKRLYRKELFKQYATTVPYERDKKMNEGTHLYRRLFQEFFHELVPVWLSMEDKVSMSASIESRLPFMDYRLVEFVFGLDDTQKIKNGITKYILRNSMSNSLPKSIIHEKQKLTFSGPQTYWLKKSLKPMIVSYFIDNTPMVSSFINLKETRELILKYYNDTKHDNYDENYLWRILNVEIFMRCYFLK